VAVGQTMIGRDAGSIAAFRALAYQPRRWQAGHSVGSTKILTRSAGIRRSIFVCLPSRSSGTTLGQKRKSTAVLEHYRPAGVRVRTFQIRRSVAAHADLVSIDGLSNAMPEPAAGGGVTPAKRRA
jgi:hypothetical protein